MWLTIAVLLLLVHKSALDQNLNFYPMNDTCIRIFDKSDMDNKQIAKFLNLNSSVDTDAYFQGTEVHSSLMVKIIYIFKKVIQFYLIL